MNFGIKQFGFAPDDPCIVIAEVGVNHNGDPAIARQLVDVAIHAGVDVVKFQAFKSEKEISRFAPKAPYQEETTSSEGNQLEMCKALELSAVTLKEMQAYCAERGIGFLVTAFETDSVDLLVDELKVDALKVASSEVTNLPFLEYVGSRCHSIVLSTGASTLSEVGLAIDALVRGGCNDLLLFHCVTNYPANIDEANLRVMNTMRQAFGVPVGFSDHTQGINVSIAAAALGSAAIEKHFTLDRNMPGPDHRASIEPGEVVALVHGVREARLALGRPFKRPQPGEMQNLKLVRKGLVATRNLPAGVRLTQDMIDMKRPATGIAPGDFSKVLGMVLTSEVVEDGPIRWEDLKP